jgi:hypothetical protein
MKRGTRIADCGMKLVLLLVIVLVLDAHAQSVETPTAAPRLITGGTGAVPSINIEPQRIYACLDAYGRFELFAEHGSFAIDLNTGKAEFKGGCTPDEAARAFFRAAEYFRAQQREAAK